MADLLTKMRKARETRLTLEGVTVTVCRPTDLEATKMRYKDFQEAVRGVAQFVCDWEGVTELDLVPGGSSDPVPFDEILFREWIEDHPEIWEPLVSGVLDTYQAHVKKREQTAKN